MTWCLDRTYYGESLEEIFALLDLTIASAKKPVIIRRRGAKGFATPPLVPPLGFSLVSWGLTRHGGGGM